MYMLSCIYKSIKYINIHIYKYINIQKYLNKYICIYNKDIYICYLYIVCYRLVYACVCVYIYIPKLIRIETVPILSPEPTLFMLDPQTSFKQKQRKH